MAVCRSGSTAQNIKEPCWRDIPSTALFMPNGAWSVGKYRVGTGEYYPPCKRILFHRPEEYYSLAQRNTIPSAGGILFPRLGEYYSPLRGVFSPLKQDYYSYTKRKLICGRKNPALRLESGIFYCQLTIANYSRRRAPGPMTTSMTMHFLPYFSKKRF